MSVIMTQAEAIENKTKAALSVQDGDILDGFKFNSLPSPVTAKMLGGSEWCIEALDVQTGAMRLDVCGKIDLSHFSEVIELIDIKHILFNKRLI